MMSLFAKDGTPKIVADCTYPVTGLGCVSRVYTDHGVFLIETHEDGPRLVLREAYGIAPEDLVKRFDFPVVIAG